MLLAYLEPKFQCGWAIFKQNLCSNMWENKTISFKCSLTLLKVNFLLKYDCIYTNMNDIILI